jgi:hypothetical protein
MSLFSGERLVWVEDRFLFLFIDRFFVKINQFFYYLIHYSIEFWDSKVFEIDLYFDKLLNIVLIIDWHLINWLLIF